MLYNAWLYWYTLRKYITNSINSEEDWGHLKKWYKDLLKEKDVILDNIDLQLYYFKKRLLEWKLSEMGVYSLKKR